MSAVRKQRGWVGLIVLLVALLIVGVLAQKLMRQMGLVSPDQDATKTAGPRGPGPTSGVPIDPTGATPVPQCDRRGEGTPARLAAADAQDMGQRIDAQTK
jgi:hypothetical protein